MEKTIEISEFKGLNDFASPNKNASYTRSLNAVVTRNGRLLGAQGLNKFRSISTASNAEIIGLMPFYNTQLTTTVYRMLPTKIEQLNTGTDAWDDVTGTALNGLSTTIPQFCVHKDTLCFTNEGLDRPRKLTGSGNSAVLGGTPPYAKGICQGWGFLFLLNVSSDGSTFDPRGILYSDVFDDVWDLCDGNTLTFDETNGELIAGLTLDDWIVIFKSDSIYRLSFDGGLVRFKQPAITKQVGLLAPLSPADCGSFGVPYLATDYRFHVTDGYKDTAVPPYVQKKLDETLYQPAARFAVGACYPDKDSYTLFYRASASDSWNRNRITFNFRTGEFSHRVYTAHEFIRLGLFRYDRTSPYTLIGSTSSLVMELDTNTETDDGTPINRYYDIDWTSLGESGLKYLKGLTLEALRNVGGRLSIEVASDMQPNFVYKEIFTLRGGSPADEYVTLNYRIDPGIRGYRFKLRLRFFHDDGVLVEIVPPVTIAYESESAEMTQVESRSPAPSRTE